MIWVGDAKLRHVGMISARLRDADREEIMALYGDCRKAIRYCFMVSCIRRVAFVDEEIAAMWGVTGTLLSPIANVWLVTTPAIERIPFSFAREARRELAEIMETHDVVRGHVFAGYERAIRFMRLLGFDVAAPEPQGREGAMFHELTLTVE